MGFFDKFKKKKISDEALSPTEPSTKLEPIQPTPTPTIQEPVKEDPTKIKIDLVLSELNNIRMQVEMINERLKIIERKIEQKGTIKYV